MTLLGQLEHGLYANPCDTMSQEEINIFHGFDEDGKPFNDENSDSESEGKSNTDDDSGASSDNRHDVFNVSEVSIIFLSL